MEQKLSIIVPAKNEAVGLSKFLPSLTGRYPDAEVIVVNDGSTDDTEAVCRQHNVRVITHPYSKGNGAAIKTGAHAARGDTLITMDADGQHKVDDIERLLATYHQGYHMVVGARDTSSHPNVGRWGANKIYNILATWVVGQKILDLTSGLRVVNTEKFREFLYLLPNGFSYPTTITMAFFRAGYSVGYIPIHTEDRIGKSHIRPLKDGVRFLLIIFRVGTLYSPLKLFLPVSMAHFLLGLAYYAYTYASYGRFTNMSALLFIASMLIFLIGLVSEQVTTLIFQKSGNR
jgi:glycosyltransferase involved in cell wall biosynthesis